VVRVSLSEPLAASVSRLTGATGPDALPNEIIMPSGLRQSSEASKVSLPTPSITTSTPASPVSALTSGTKSRSR